MSDSTRSRILEVMARAVSIDLGEDPDALDVLIYDRPGKRPHWEGYESAAQAALTAYESHLSAEGMAVVPVEPTEKMLASAAFCDRGSGRRRTIADILTAEYKAMLSAYAKESA